MRLLPATSVKGMDNVRQSTFHLADNTGALTPRAILNADVSSDLSLTKRTGYTRRIDLPNPHSLFAGSVLLCCSNNILYRLEGTVAIPITAVSGPLTYTEINYKVYISSPTYKGVYDSNTDGVSTWGLSLPAMPQVTLTSGNLPPGRYALAYTNLRSDGLISGNGPILEVEFYGAAAGLTLTNLSSSLLCWMTDTNGSDLFLATVASNNIVQPHYNLPLPSLFVIPPPFFSLLAQAFGRIWGVVGKKLYFSEPNAYEWFKEANSFHFPENIIMVAPVQAGIYVASSQTTWVLKGTDPTKMILQRVADGVIPGSLCYDELQQSGTETPYWRHKSVLPVWVGERGFTIGNEHLAVANLTESRLDIPLGTSAASLVRKVAGQAQIMVSMRGAAGSLDSVFAGGRMFSPKPFNVVGSGGVEVS